MHLSILFWSILLLQKSHSCFLIKIGKKNYQSSYNTNFLDGNLFSVLIAYIVRWCNSQNNVNNVLIKGFWMLQSVTAIKETIDCFVDAECDD